MSGRAGARPNNDRQRLDGLSGRLQRTTQHALSLHRERLNTLTARLATLNPAATLARGYAIVQKEETVVTRTNQVAKGEALVVKVSDGEFGVMVKGERDGEE